MARVEDLTWRKSSRSSSNGGNCVEVAHLPGHDRVFIRDSKDVEGPMLRVSADEFRAFLSSLE